jgi:LysR family hydrogen peroxide-inducible transcriptional activator
VNIRDLQYLVAVADHGHFGRAAEACYVSQPTLSTQLKKLERELGVELVERTTQGALLTPAGHEIVRAAREILVHVDDIYAIAKRSADPEAATLRIGLFPTLAPYLLPHIVPAIHDRFPKLELLLSEEKTELVLERLRNGGLDAGVLALPIRDDGLVVEPLFDEDFVLVVPADHRLAQGPGEPVGVDALAQERLLLLEEGHCLRDHALALCDLAGATERRGFRATSLETLRQMVAAGVGMTLLPALALRAPVTPSHSVAVRRFTDPAPSRRVALCWRRSSVHRDLLLKVADVIRARVSDHDLPVVSVHHDRRVEDGRGDGV